MRNKEATTFQEPKVSETALIETIRQQQEQIALLTNQVEQWQELEKNAKQIEQENLQMQSELKSLKASAYLNEKVKEILGKEADKIQRKQKEIADSIGKINSAIPSSDGISRLAEKLKKFDDASTSLIIMNFINAAVIVIFLVILGVNCYFGYKTNQKLDALENAVYTQEGYSAVNESRASKAVHDAMQQQQKQK